MATATMKPRSLFGDLLRSQLDEQALSVKGLARRLAGPGASREQVESERRTLNRYLSGDVSPGEEARQRIAEALTVNAAVFAEEAVLSARRERLAKALLPLADVLLEIAVEVAHEKDKIA